MALNALTVTVSYKNASAAYAAQLPNENDGGLEIGANVFPNPSINNFNLKLKSSVDETVEIRVTDIIGREVYQTRGKATGSYAFGEHFTGGVYLVEIIHKGGIKTLKIVKQ